MNHLTLVCALFLFLLNTPICLCQTSEVLYLQEGEETTSSVVNDESIFITCSKQGGTGYIKEISASGELMDFIPWINDDSFSANPYEIIGSGSQKYVSGFTYSEANVGYSYSVISLENNQFNVDNRVSLYNGLLSHITLVGDTLVFLAETRLSSCALGKGVYGDEPGINHFQYTGFGSWNYQIRLVITDPKLNILHSALVGDTTAYLSMRDVSVLNNGNLLVTYSQHSILNYGSDEDGIYIDEVNPTDLFQQDGRRVKVQRSIGPLQQIGTLTDFDSSYAFLLPLDKKILMLNHDWDIENPLNETREHQFNKTPRYIQELSNGKLLVHFDESAIISVTTEQATLTNSLIEIEKMDGGKGSIFQDANYFQTHVTSDSSIIQIASYDESEGGILMNDVQIPQTTVNSTLIYYVNQNVPETNLAMGDGYYHFRNVYNNVITDPDNSDNLIDAPGNPEAYIELRQGVEIPDDAEYIPSQWQEELQIPEGFKALPFNWMHTDPYRPDSLNRFFEIRIIKDSQVILNQDDLEVAYNLRVWVTHKRMLYNGNYDSDEDGIYDLEDNCPNIPNVLQEDLDEDGEGDICDNDIDGDEVINFDDNCPYEINPNQEDFDGDGDGDVCDYDIDGDGVYNNQDECDYTPLGTPVNDIGCLLTNNSNIFSSNDLNAFPNPCRDVIYISSSTDELIQLFSITGELLDQTFISLGKSNHLNMSNYPSGIYYLKTNNGVVISVIKI